ncbi:MAG: hypothetical protein GY870_11575 [archaeon]|nr:hypothetical protein [archaeon]
MKMRHRHITKRSFKTNCRECGKPILYWECDICHAKTFFSLPIYGKPIRHICDKYLVPKQKKLPKWRTPVEEKERKPLDVKEITTFNCPVCDKIFRNENQFNDHIKQMKRFDEDHKIFFGNVLDMINFDFNEEENVEEKEKYEFDEDLGQKEGIKKSYQKDYSVKPQAVFGKVQMRVKKKKK